MNNHRNPCREMVAYPELFDMLPCSLGDGHLAPHRSDGAEWDRRAVAMLRKYRTALERIANDEMGHDCMVEDIHDVTVPCVQIANEAMM